GVPVFLGLHRRASSPRAVEPSAASAAGHQYCSRDRAGSCQPFSVRGSSLTPAPSCEDVRDQRYPGALRTCSIGTRDGRILSTSGQRCPLRLICEGETDGFETL